MQFLKENKQILYLLFVLPIFFFYFDIAIIEWIRDFHKYDVVCYSFLKRVDTVVNFFSHGVTQLTIAFILFVLGRFFNQRLYEVSQSLIIAFLSSGITAQILKHIIGRARPRLTDKTVFIGPSFKSGYDSFPSGHVAVTFCLAYILSQYFPKYRIGFYTFAVILAFERVEDISHFPSDVLAGAVVGFVVGGILSRKMVQHGLGYVGNYGK